MIATANSCLQSSGISSKEATPPNSHSVIDSIS